MVSREKFNRNPRTAASGPDDPPVCESDGVCWALCAQAFYSAQDLSAVVALKFCCANELAPYGIALIAACSGKPLRHLMVGDGVFVPSLKVRTLARTDMSPNEEMIILEPTRCFSCECLRLPIRALAKRDLGLNEIQQDRPETNLGCELNKARES